MADHETPALLMWAKPSDRAIARISFSRFDGSEPVTVGLPDEINRLKSFMAAIAVAVAQLEASEPSDDDAWPSIEVWVRRASHGKILASFGAAKPSKKKTVDLPRNLDQLHYFERRAKECLDLVRHIPKNRGYTAAGGEDREHWKYERPTMGSQGTGKRR